MIAVKKLTPKTAGLDKSVLSDLIADADGPTNVMNVVGRILGAEQKNGDLGPYVIFNGNFSAKTAINPDEEIRSNVLIVPGVAEMVLVAQCGGCKAAYPDPIAIMLKIGIAPNTDSRSADTNPYVWTVETAGEAPKDDFISQLWAEVEGPKQLEAPKGKAKAKAKK